MKYKSTLCALLSLLMVWCYSAQVMAGPSVYTLRPDDPEAFYFVPEKYNFIHDGKSDVSDALQTAMNQVKKEKNFGILFIPEGNYRLTKTVMIPSGIRLIGYGTKRPVFYVAPDTPAFQKEQTAMVWFTGGGAVTDVNKAQDAGAGTFYSAVSNIDFRIDKGNPQAVAIRCHAAQHSFINHVDIQAGQGLAGIWDVGNELEDVRIFGGRFGITSQRTSPGWPMMLVDTYFEGQTQAAIYAREVGMALVNMQVKNAPVAIEMADNVVDRLYVENSAWENVQTGVLVSVDDNTFGQLNLKGVDCKNVPVLVKHRHGNQQIAGIGKMYRADEVISGYQFASMDAEGKFEENQQLSMLSAWPQHAAHTLPLLPPMEQWVNVMKYGAKGDGQTDDTPAFERALKENKVVYVPQGWYRLTSTLQLPKDARLIGLHPFGTQLKLKESEPAFSGFGSPVPLVETIPGGDTQLNGIGINTGAYNYRAVGLKWTAGAASYLNDVKFVGGHGTMGKPGVVSANGSYGSRGNGPTVSSPETPVYNRGQDQAWDTQYWSLWITDNGGGTIKDIWTADTYAASGLYISNTSTEGRIYAISIEHHVRTEARLHNVKNWKIYCFQFEEETLEGPDDHMAEVSDCQNLEFINVWMYRVIRIKTPKEIGFHIWNCKDVVFRNMHNYTQILPVIEYPVYDMNRQLPMPAWDFAYLRITGQEASKVPTAQLWQPVRISTGYEMAAGLTADSKGNVYFGQNRLKKIYKWNASTQSLALIADYPWKPFTMVADTQDNLIVICRYDPQPGRMVNGKQEGAPKLPDDNPMYSSWGNGGWSTFAYAIRNGKGDDMVPLQRINSADAKGITRVVHPASRWRGDYETIVSAMAGTSFLAPDGKTLIPETYDLGRSCGLVTVTPGQQAPVYVVNENNKTTRRYKVSAQGTLQDDGQFCPFGQYGNVTDAQGNVYVADGDIRVYRAGGSLLKRIPMDERPLSMTIGGEHNEYLFVTTTRSLYQIRIG